MSEEATTRIDAIVQLRGEEQKPGGTLHSAIMDHFVSERFKEYAAGREVNEELLRDLSGELTSHMRNEDVRSRTGLSETVATLVTNVKGYEAVDNTVNNSLVFSIELIDGETE